MSKITVGDRVAVYEQYRAVGVVDSINTNGAIRLESKTRWYHPKQCRKLVKKERRRVWLDEPSLRNLETGEKQGEVYGSLQPMVRSIEFVEVRRKK